MKTKIDGTRNAASYIRKGSELIYSDKEFEEIISFTSDKIELAKRTNRCIATLATLEYGLHLVALDEVFAKETLQLANAEAFLEISSLKGDDGELLYTNETARESAVTLKLRDINAKAYEDRKARDTDKAFILARINLLSKLIDVNKVYLSMED